MTDKLRVGVIIKSHGIKGEVKVYPTTDSPLRFDEITHAEIVVGGRTDGDREIEGVKYFKDTVIVKFEGVDDMTAAERLRGAELCIPRSEGAALEDGEYYIADIIGMTVMTDTGARLGTVKDVMETGANDVYVVKLDDGFAGAGTGLSAAKREVLIPAIRQCILDTDIEKNVMTVHLLDGLLEL